MMKTKKKWNKDVRVYPEIVDVREEGITIPATAGRAGADPLGATVETALRQTLGWRPRTGDVDGFRAALNQAIIKTAEEGQTRWSWQAPTTIIRVEGGAVTGAQASLFSRIQAAVDQSQPLLSGLKALVPDPDQEDVEASQAIIRNALNELVNEMGTVGGPRPQRVDELFAMLLGKKPKGTQGYQYTPDNVPGQLGTLQKRMGLYRGRVNTIEEERNLTNFLILVDYVHSLQKNWEEQRKYFERGSSDVYLGTQLVHLTRYLGVIAEQAQEVAFILDSVYVDEAERQSIELPGSKPPLTITELLSWVEHFATVEGPYLIQDGGKDGVIAMTPTLVKLEKLTTQAAQIAGKLKDNPTPGVHTPRVERSFNELSQHLQKAIELAEAIQRFSQPKLKKPDNLTAGDLQRVSLNGEGFLPVPSVILEGQGQTSGITQIDGESITFASKKQVDVTFDLSNIAYDPYDKWIIRLTNPDGGSDQVVVKIDPPGSTGGGPSGTPGSGGPGYEELLKMIEELTILMQGTEHRLDRLNAHLEQQESAHREGIDALAGRVEFLMKQVEELREDHTNVAESFGKRFQSVNGRLTRYKQAHDRAIEDFRGRFESVDDLLAGQSAQQSPSQPPEEESKS